MPTYDKIIKHRMAVADRVETFFRAVEFGQVVQFSNGSPELVESESCASILTVPTDQPVTGPIVQTELRYGDQRHEFPPTAKVYKSVIFESAEFIGGGLAVNLAEDLNGQKCAVVALESDDEDRELFAWVILHWPA